MADPVTVRETLIAEAIGEAGRLLLEIEAQRVRLDASCHQLTQTAAQLHEALAGFEGQMTAITEAAKVRTVQHLARHADDITRRTVDQQSRAMAEAARIAFGAEVGAAMQRLQEGMRTLAQRSRPAWEAWVTHAAALATGSSLTCVLIFVWWPR